MFYADVRLVGVAVAEIGCSRITKGQRRQGHNLSLSRLIEVLVDPNGLRIRRGIEALLAWNVSEGRRQAIQCTRKAVAGIKGRDRIGRIARHRLRSEQQELRRLRTVSYNRIEHQRHHRMVEKD